ncbi:hypothetical protein NQ318_006869 [Aromia moschata]|uniref:Protein MAK10 homolog n=1 Tax=Aromia moschata TaxID=1265417 RepID=A0AAV8YJF4_9CUCU|nr:hypothetical protein NQ318_006869 [Aromia moschata]
MDTEMSNTSSWKIPNNWTNITETFHEAVKDLKLGELLHDDLFGLFEAMSAIEMMTLKWMPECCAIGALGKLYLLTRQFRFVCDLPVLKITMLSILGRYFKIRWFWRKRNNWHNRQYSRCLVSWLEGHSLAQTVFINLYLHKPYMIEDRVLKAFCLSVYKLLEIIKDLVHKKEDQQPSIPDCQRLLTTSIEMLYIVQDTVYIGIKNEDPNNEHIIGFEPSINQRLLPPTFPRYTKIKSRAEALIYFIEMVERFKVACKIQSITSLHQALDFFIEFSKSSPCILSRSALQLLYPGTNPSNLKDILKDAVKSFICPPALLSKTLLGNQQAKHYVDTFLSHCSRPLLIHTVVWAQQS